MRPLRSFLLITFLWVQILGAEGQAHLRVHVTDAYGNPVPPQMLELTGEDGKTIEPKQDEVRTVKYGLYSVKARAQGFAVTVNTFLVDQPEQILSVTMKLGAMEVPVPLCSIAGHVAPDNRITRIRALQPFGSYSVDVPVADGGSFRFESLECGDYMMLAMGPKGCIASTMFRATPRGPKVEIRVSELSGGACSAGR